MPFSYAQYAGNGSATTFSVPFPYLLKGHVKLYTGYNILNGTFASQLVDGVGYTWTSGTQVQTTVAPAVGVTLTIVRETPDSSQVVVWNDGSNLIADDQNTADLQNLYVVQEQQDRNDAVVTLSQTVKTASETATSAANTALSNSTAAQATAASAVSTANAANATSASALSVANTKGDAAIATANAASTSATNAVSTANAATASAAGAVTTANAATASAAGAVTTANAADVKADAAIAAVASSVNYTGVANVAAIPATPANNTYIEVLNATGLESFTPLAGMPVGFVGDSGLRVRLRYTTSGSTWNWIDYAPTNPDGRYVNKTSISSSVTSTSTTTVANSAAVKTAKDAADSAGLAAAAAQGAANTAASDAATAQSAAAAAQSTANTGVSNAASAQSTANTAASNAATAQSTANAALPKAGGTMTGGISFVVGQTFPTSGISSATIAAPGIVQLSDSTSSTSSSTAATSAAVKAVQDFAQVVSTTANAAMPRTGGTFTGDVTFGTTTATRLSVGTTAERPTGTSGMIRFNTTLSQFEGFNGTVWSSVGGGATGGGADRVFQENDNAVTTNYTLSASRNAVTAGPVTVNSGVTVTIPSGSAWVIV